MIESIKSKIWFTNKSAKKNGAALLGKYRPCALALSFEVYNYIAHYIVIYGYSPTYEEIAHYCGMPRRRTVHFHVHKLIDIGCLAFVKKPKISSSTRRRNLAVVKTPQQALRDLGATEKDMQELEKYLPLALDDKSVLVAEYDIQT